MENTVVDDKTIGVISTSWTDMFPYFASRDLGSTLRTGDCYTRRDGVIGRMTHVEIEHHIRAKSARLGPLIIREPLQCGFVIGGDWSGPYGPILKVTNISESEIKDVAIVFDVRCPSDTTAFQRVRAFNGPLMVGQSRELELDLKTLYLQVGGERLSPSSSLVAKWIDVIARIRYRNMYGLLQEIQVSTFVAN